MTTSYIRECNTQMTTMYDMTPIPWTIFGYEVASCDVLTYLNLIHETNHFSKPNNQINWEKNNQKKRAWIVLFSNSKAEINYHDAIIYDYDKKNIMIIFTLKEMSTFLNYREWTGCHSRTKYSL